MTRNTDVLDAVAAVERAAKNHKDAEIKLFERLRSVLHAHSKAVCRGLLAILQAFPDRKIVAIIEAEIANLGCMARPEDVVLWIEGVGAFVIEAKSHTIDGIRRFENDVPCIVYHGREVEDVELLDQPKDFAYKLLGELDKACAGAGIEPPPLYYAGWMPNISPEDVAQRDAMVRKDRVWLSDMLDRDTFLSRIPDMKNLTRGRNVDRSGLTAFCSVFGITSGLRRSAPPRSAPTGSMGQLIDRKRLALKRLTKEQEELAFHPNLVRGPKVIRGVAGSGLRKAEDDFGFARAQDDKPNPAKQFTTILTEGPGMGVHVLVWCDSLNNVQRSLERQTLREFEMRVVFQMSAGDSSTLIDSPMASKLGMHRAFFHSEEQGKLEKFRPYGVPSQVWLDGVNHALASKRVPS
jgi:hypothetical protein